MMNGEQAREQLRQTLASGGVIIGAGAGTGLSAKCAEAGGADLIIIYNSGRYRMAGRGSLAGMMPYGDALLPQPDQGHGFCGRPEFPDGWSHRRHLPAKSGRDWHGLRSGGHNDK